MEIITKLIICLIAGAGAGIGTGFAGIASKIANRVDAVKLSRITGLTMIAFSAMIIIVNYVL